MGQPHHGECFGPVFRYEGRASSSIECGNSGHRRVLGQGFQGLFHRGLESEIVNGGPAAGENNEEIRLTLPSSSSKSSLAMKDSELISSKPPGFSRSIAPVPNTTANRKITTPVATIHFR